MRQELIREIATCDTPGVKASKAQTLDKQREQSKQDSDRWLAAVAKSDAAQDLKEQEYLARFVHTQHGWRPIQPGEIPGAQYPK